MTTIRRTIIINATLVAILLALVVGLSTRQGQGRLMKEIHRIEMQTERMSSKPANVVSSCSALVAVFFAWRSFTGYRRRCQS